MAAVATRSVFISYAREDRLDVEASADLLRAGGVQVFIDVRDIAFGDRWEDALQQALVHCERVLVFWSLAARASEWVEREWRCALALDKRIVPTLLDPTPLPPELACFQALPRWRPAAPATRASRSARTLLLGAAGVAAAGGAALWWPAGRVSAPATQPAGLPASAPAVVPAPAPLPEPRPAPIPVPPLKALGSLPDRLRGLSPGEAVAWMDELAQALDPQPLRAATPAQREEWLGLLDGVLPELRRMDSQLRNGTATFDTAAERQAFAALLQRAEAASQVLREAPTPPAPTPAPSPPAPPPPVTPDPEAGLSVSGALLGAALLGTGAGLAFVWRRRVRLGRDARRFVDAVFAA